MEHRFLISSPIFLMETVIPRLPAALHAGDFLLTVEFPEQLLKLLPEEKHAAVIGVLSHDPRPSYQREPSRIYGLSFSGFDIRFTVDQKTLTVQSVRKIDGHM